MYRAQKNNTAGGHIIGGDNITNVISTHSPLARLYERLRAQKSNDNYSAKIADKLQHFCSQSTDGDIRGLIEKLSTSDRNDMVAMATRLKQDASQIIMKYQTSPVAQDIITLILSKIYSDFVLHVTPAIQEGSSRQVVDGLISDKVVTPAMTMLGDNDMMLTDTDILGLMYFLAGNCHIRWDKC